MTLWKYGIRLFQNLKQNVAGPLPFFCNWKFELFSRMRSVFVFVFNLSFLHKSFYVLLQNRTISICTHKLQFPILSIYSFLILNKFCNNIKFLWSKENYTTNFLTELSHLTLRNISSLHVAYMIAKKIVCASFKILSSLFA